MCFIIRFLSMTKGDIVLIIFVDVKGLIMSLMSYYDITIYTIFSILIHVNGSTSILKKGCM
jgi:hypothetical protein